jgi:hypothetical protein
MAMARHAGIDTAKPVAAINAAAAAISDHGKVAAAQSDRLKSASN